jgi:hypothetical protein
MSRKTVEAKLAACPNRKNHTKVPGNYVTYHEWAAKKSSQGWVPTKCEGCDLLVIWVPPVRSVGEGTHKGSTQTF